MKRGVPPTALKARTGEFTPPGVTARARSKRAPDAAVRAVAVGGHTPIVPEAANRPGSRSRPGPPGVLQTTPSRRSFTQKSPDLSLVHTGSGPGA